jgi:hypothetical protein
MVEKSSDWAKDHQWCGLNGHNPFQEKLGSAVDPDTVTLWPQAKQKLNGSLKVIVDDTYNI